jgi:hypothetical protein
MGSIPFGWKRTRTALECGCLTTGHTHTHHSCLSGRERGACALAWIVYCLIELHSARERPLRVYHYLCIAPI